MKVLYLIQQSRLKINWSRLARPGLRIILITNTESRTKLLESDTKFVDVIYLTESFEFEFLKALIQENFYINHKGSTDFAIVTIDEFLVFTVSQLNEHFSISGISPSQAKNYLNKVQMKNELKKTSLRIPRFVHHSSASFIQDSEKYIDSVIKAIGLPCFIKPVAAAGSVGTNKVKSRTDLLAWASKQNGNQDYEIDEFIHGELYHCDSVVVNGQVRSVFSGKYFFPVASFFEGKVCGSIALQKHDEVHKKLSDLNFTALSALGMPNGAYHLEAFRTPAGEFIFLEVAARPAGGMIPEMYEKAFGINIQEAHIISQLYGEILPVAKENQEALWLWIPLRDGIIKKINTPPVKSHYEYHPRYKIGDRIKKSTDVIERFGGLIVWGNQPSLFREDFSLLVDSFQFYDVSVD